MTKKNLHRGSFVLVDSPMHPMHGRIGIVESDKPARYLTVSLDGVRYGMMSAELVELVRKPDNGVELQIKALEAILEMHNNGGQRWVGFPRADTLQQYCTGCQYAAPCPTVAKVKEMLP